ncbi:MAG: 4a-hydroxytetrahydrobiopterin dehydratase [Candidatus Melainabacteria bacterium]
MLLSPQQVKQALPELPGWQLVHDALERVVDCPTYPVALALVQAIGIHAEAVNHHPDMMLHYKRLTIRYHTHTPSGITEKDFEGVQAVNQLLSALPGS